MPIEDDEIGTTSPTFRASIRFLKTQLRQQAVTAQIPLGCLAVFVMNAAEAALRNQRAGEAWIQCLNQHLQVRARFIFLWTTSDEWLDNKEFGDLFHIARRCGLARGQNRGDPQAVPRPQELRVPLSEHLVAALLEGAAPPTAPAAGSASSESSGTAEPAATATQKR